MKFFCMISCRLNAIQIWHIPFPLFLRTNKVHTILSSYANHISRYICQNQNTMRNDSLWRRLTYWSYCRGVSCDPALVLISYPVKGSKAPAGTWLRRSDSGERNENKKKTEKKVSSPFSSLRPVPHYLNTWYTGLYLTTRNLTGIIYTWRLGGEISKNTCVSTSPVYRRRLPEG